MTVHLLPKIWFFKGGKMKDWCIEVWGEYACFTRPEMKVERVSYDVMTPSAARAIFEAIMWKPAIKWHISKIDILQPIKWVTVRRNEVGKTCNNPTSDMMKGVPGKPMGINIEDERQQRAGLFLKDVKYRIYGHFEFIPPERRKPAELFSSETWADSTEKENATRSDESAAKYAAMFERRAKKGQCFNRPYLGCREFSCYFRLVDPEKEPAQSIGENRELGWMLYDMDFSDPQNPMPMFFKASLVDGRLNTDRREIEVRR
jgi:CRISPR-associated protein Cas5d